MLRKCKLQMARFDLVSLCSSAALALPQGKEVFCPAKVKPAIKADICSSHRHSVQKPPTCWSGSSDGALGEHGALQVVTVGQVTEPSIPPDVSRGRMPRDADRACHPTVCKVFLPNIYGISP